MEKQGGHLGVVAHVRQQVVVITVFDLWRENIGSATKRPDQNGGPGQSLIFGGGVMVDKFNIAGLDQVGGFPIAADTFESKDGVDGGIRLAVVDTVLRGSAIRGGYAGDNMLVGEDVGEGG